MKGGFQKTLVKVSKMDCPSEEALIRSAFRSLTVQYELEFDLQERRLTIMHEGSEAPFVDALNSLKLDPSLIESHPFEGPVGSAEKVDVDSEERVLRTLIFVNAGMFIAEISFGFFAESTGLIADSMDMLADAAVYSLSLFAVRHTIHYQRRAARASGFLQIALAAGAAIEIVRRFLMGSDPEPSYMIGVALMALVANVLCMVLLTKHREGGVHMKASWIFSTNDVIANVGVLLAGALVALTGSHIPDLVVGGIIVSVVFRGGLKILKLSQA